MGGRSGAADIDRAKEGQGKLQNISAIAVEVRGEVEILLEQYQNAKEDISYEAVLDEAAANYAGRMLEDGMVLDDFTEKHRSDRTLLEKVRDAIRAIVAKLTGEERRQAQTAEGKLTAALEAAAKQTERLTAQKNTAQEGGEVRYSLNEDFGRQFDKWMEDQTTAERKTVTFVFLLERPRKPCKALACPTIKSTGVLVSLPKL